MNELNVPGKIFKDFIETKEYKRFHEFADAVSSYRYIGVCYGEPGIGKSLAASYYARWSDMINEEYSISPIKKESKNTIKKCRSVLFTAPVTNTPKTILQQVQYRIDSYGRARAKLLGIEDINMLIFESKVLCPLVIIDEADRLNINSLEQLRHLYDEIQFGLILIGMPGIEKRFARYPQLFSRIGFSHEFRKLSEDEMTFIFPKIWKVLGINYDSNNFSDVEAMKAVVRITRGNFRLIDRMFAQMQRIVKINNLKCINIELVEAARNCLIIGDPE